MIGASFMVKEAEQNDIQGEEEEKEKEEKKGQRREGLDRVGLFLEWGIKEG